MAQDILTEAIPARLYAEGSALNLARAALFGVPLSKVESIVELLRTYRGGRPNSLIGGGPLGWSWYSTLAAMATDHHGNVAGFGGTHHAHSQLSGVGIDDHHARDHAARHQLGGADQVSLDLSQIGTGWGKQSFINLLENGDFEIGDPPTGWTLWSGTFSRSTEQVRLGTYSAKLVKGAYDARFYQDVANYADYKGKTVTVGMWIYASQAGTNFCIEDGVGVSWSPNHSGVAGWEWITKTRAVSASATKLTVKPYMTGADPNMTSYFDGAILVEGEVCPAFSPKPPRYKEQDTSEIITGRFGMARMPGGAAGLVLTAQGAGADPAYAAIDFPKKLKPALTRWAIQGWGFTAGTTSTAVAGRIYYIPIFVEETTTYIRIGVEITSAAAGSADLRIFAWNNGVPGALVLSAGTVDTGTTGLKEITISQQLTRGYYFLAIRCSAAPDLRGPHPTYITRTPVSAFNDSGTPLAGYIITYVDAAYADPAPAPTGRTELYRAYVILREN